CAALLAAMRGDLAEADARLDAINSRETTDDLATRTWYLRLRSVVELLRGDLERAYDVGMEAVHADPAGMNTPTALWDAARAAIWMRDAPKVRDALEAPAPLRGRWAGAARNTLIAGLAAIEDRREEAIATYAEAFAAWNALGSPIDHAFTAIDAITLLPDESVSIEAAAQARATLEELGVGPLLTRLTMAERRASADAQ